MHTGSGTCASSSCAFGQWEVTCGFSPSEDAASENINQLCCVKCATGVGRGGGTMQGERHGKSRWGSAQVSAHGQGGVGAGDKQGLCGA